MKAKLLLRNPKKYILLVSSLLLLSAIPYFAGSGLDNPEPMGSYLNANFPATIPQGLPYEPVFPNLTFDSPLTFNELPNANKIIVGQRDGKIFWFDKTPSVSTKNVLLDLSEKVGVVWDGGFLGLTLHPDFGTVGNNYFYVYYTTEDANSNDFPNSYTTQSCNSQEYWGNFLVLARYEMDPVTLNVQESSEQILIKIRMYGTTHRGGGLLFGNDGFLYLTTGDQTAFKKAQDITNNIDGGVLRLDVDKDISKSHPPVRTMPDDHGFSDELTGNGYWIPNDNPFLSPTGANFEEYYSLGHRNPHRMTKDRETGELYVGEIGGGRHEEINVIKKGKNYGWPLYEGLYYSTFCVPELLNGMDHEKPLTFFPRSEANSVIGGYVYRGDDIPELQGKYICADYGIGEEIWSIDINTGSYTQLGSFSSTDIISFGEDQDAELYIMKLGVSTLYKMISKNNLTGSVPQFLSQTGAFEDLGTLEPTDGLIPYDLIESFWSDGAIKKRWIGIPNDGTHNNADEKINYSEDDVWNFPVGSVLVKHFELPIDENDPSITKRLETRFSIKAADGDFYFVTYKWNDLQTDAELVLSGSDENINITKADGSTDIQTWRYPSTGDCISCHNSSSGGTLGTRSRYLNKDYTYPKTGRTGNQLVTLSHLGILDQAVSDIDTEQILTYKSIDDISASLDEKARSYMDLNCAYCHRPGTGNRSEFDLRLKMDIVQTGLLTATPYESLGIPNEKIVDPGNPATSILYHRVNSIDPSVKMPPIAKNKIDDKAVQLIYDWIGQLDPDPCADRIIMETFDNIPGVTLDELRNDPDFPLNPSKIDELSEFSIPVDVADNYGVRVKGILKAPETGTYYFWISGDDNVELSLSSDVDETNKVRIAYHDSWSSYLEWNKFPTQKSIAIHLDAGQNYYIEALMNESGGGDNLSVGWRRPSDGNGTVPSEVIPCTVFDYFNGPPIVNVTGVSLDLSTATVTEGDTQQLTATVAPVDATDQGIAWGSDDTSVATVDATGLVTAVAAGTATITVTTTDGGFTATSTITVVAAAIAVTGVSLDLSTATVTEGDTQQLTATVAPVDATDQGIAWGSDDTSVATVDATGLVTAVAAGTATITVTTADGGFTATSTITVGAAPIAVTGVSLTPATATLVAGATQQLTAVVSPPDASNPALIWVSSDPAVATVAVDGWVTAVAEGTATITVTTIDGGFEANSTIVVNDDCMLSNVALGGIATQSSTYGNGQASLAVDGNTTGSNPHGPSADLQHTESEGGPWWQVDLGADHTIDKLNIFNRSNVLQSRLNNFYVFVSATPFSSGASLADLIADTGLTEYYFAGEAGLEETITFNAEGRYVRIQLSGNGILHMSEVEVMGCFLQASPCDGVAPVTIDPPGPYLDTDTFQNLVGNPAGGTWSGASTDGTFDPGMGAGTYSVTYTYDNGLGCIQSDTKDIVVNTAGTGGCTLTNVALGGIATQSSTYGNGQASLAVDGNTTGSNPHGPSADLQHTESEGGPWWQVDLGADHTIDKLNIFNRSNVLQSRLNNFYVFVSATPFSSGASLADLIADTGLTEYYFAGEAGLEETITFNAEGRYVRIQLSGNGILHMSEVEVMGCFLQASPCDGVAPVTIDPPGPYLDTDTFQNLVGNPAGGTWSGASTDGTFDPGMGAGTYSVTYTYDNGLGCIQSDTKDIVVNTAGTGGCTLTNVALGGIATQSSTYGNGQASLAVDGNTTGSNPHGPSADLQHTESEGGPWWQVDLGADHTIDKLNIFNRSNVLQSRLNNFYVFVSATPFSSGASLADLIADTGLTEYYFAGEAGLEETITFNAEGRYVRIQLSGNGILHMSEVEVMGCFLQASPCDGVAPVTIDPPGPYLDTDTFQNLVGNPAGGTWSGASTDGTFDPGMGAGTYSVTYTYDNGLGCIQSDTKDIVVNTAGTGGCTLTNVALGGIATQSSTYGNGQASLAVDGNTTGSNPHGPSADLQHTESEGGPWWQVDLGADHTIDKLNIFNRSNVLQSRLNNFYVFVSATPFSSGASLADLIADTGLTEYYFAGEAGLEETITFNAEGRYVRIQLSGNGILHMSEVEVMGCSVDDGSTSLKAFTSSSSSLTLSPVPVSTILNVDYFFANDVDSAFELTIFDNIGRQIQSGTFTADTFNGQLNVSKLAPGVYLLRLQKEDEIITKRFTVIR